MAEAITRAHAQDRGVDVEVASAGTQAESVITPHAVEVLRARGIEVGPRRAVQLTAPVAREADLVLGMTAEHVAAAAELGVEAHVWPQFVGETGEIPDPMGHPLAVYEATAARMSALADALLDRVRSRTLPA